MNNRKTTLIVLSIILLITAIVFSSSINNDFTNWDDPVYITDNVAIRDFSINNISKILFSNIGLKGSRFTVFVFAIEYQLWELNPMPYHLTNYLFHLANVALVFSLILLLFNRIEIAAIAALFFGIHPMHVESVAWISQLKDMLYTFFYLSTLICYVFYIKKEGNIKYLLTSFLLFSLSYYSKLSAASLPFVLFIFDYYYQRKFSWKLVREKTLFFIVIIYPYAKYFIKRILLHLPPSHPSPIEMPELIPDYSFVERIFLAGYSLVFYVVKFFAPVHLYALHPYPEKINGMLPSEYYSAFFIAVVMIITIAIALWKMRQAKRELIFGILFFFITISIFLHIIPVKGVIIVGDRYTYIPYIGLFILVGHFYCLVADRKLPYTKWIKPFFLVVLTGYTVFFSIASWGRNKVWKDGSTLFTDVIQKNPKVIQAYINRGNMKRSLKDYEGALEDYQKAIELKPEFAYPYNNRGIVNADLKNYTQALADFNKAIELFPRYVEGYCNRADMKVEMGDYQGALADFNKAIEIKPDHASAYNDRGTLRYMFRDYTGAIEDFSKAIKWNPNHWEAYNNRGNTKNILQDYRNAISDFEKCIVLNPELPDAYNNRGYAKNNLKDYEGALLDLGKAIQLRPEFAEAYNNRAIAYVNLRDYKTATQDLNKAIAIRPDYVDAYNNRGIVKTYSGDYEGSIADFAKLIELNPENINAYMNRANSNLKTNRIEEACNDWMFASKLGFVQANDSIRKYCRPIFLIEQP